VRLCDLCACGESLQPLLVAACVKVSVRLADSGRVRTRRRRLIKDLCVAGAYKYCLLELNMLCDCVRCLQVLQAMAREQPQRFAATLARCPADYAAMAAARVGSASQGGA
jgi:hypothetical protein